MFCFCCPVPKILSHFTIAICLVERPNGQMVKPWRNEYHSFLTFCLLEFSSPFWLHCCFLLTLSWARSKRQEFALSSKHQHITSSCTFGVCGLAFWQLQPTVVALAIGHCHARRVLRTDRPAYFVCCKHQVMYFHISCLADLKERVVSGVLRV